MISWRIVSCFLVAIVAIDLDGAFAQSASKNDLVKGMDPQISGTAFFAGTMAKENAEANMPSLNYWGFQGVPWGAIAAEVGSSKAEFASGAKGGTIACSFGGLNCTLQLGFAGGGAQLSAPADNKNGMAAIVRRFAEGVRDRSARLGMYKRLKSELEKVYGAPTNSVFPENSVRGRDAFVQGLDERYQVAWRGTETVVSLLLTADELVLTYQQAPTSRARQQTELLRQFEVFKASLSADHSLRR